MPNLDKENTKKEDQNEKNEDIVSEENTDDAETKKTAKVFDFNSLEDTILAAASAQGIEIPEKEEATTSFPGPDEETAEDEELTEEDLRLAEEEFLNGPAPRKGTKEIKEPVVMDLESEESLTQKPETDEEDEEENSFINEILGIRKSPKKSSKKAEEEKKEKSEEITLEPEQETDKEEVKEENFDHTAELERFLAMFEDEDEEKEHIVYAREKQLSDEEKKLFTYFIKVPGMKEQLVEMLCKVQEGAIHSSSSTGNIMVMGGKETGKTRLISAIIPAICKQFGIEATKVAYVFAEQINGKDVKKMVEKLAGGFFVIENINQLDAATAEKLNEALSKDTKGMILIVEDEKIGMRKFIMKYPKLANKFSSMINIPVFTNDELVNFARVYTRENGFKIDQMGMLALYNLISENQKADEPMNIGVVKELLDNAIAKASGGLFKRKKKRMDRDGYIVLQEKDFI